MDMRYDDGHTSGLANVIGNVSEIQSEHDLRAQMAMSHKTNEDVVNHPSHYNQYNGFEVIDVCEQLRAPDGTGNYNRGNAFKYLARAGWKDADKHVQDLEKAVFYIQREIDRINSDNWMNTTPTLAELKEALHAPNDSCGGQRPKQNPIGAHHYCPDCGVDLMSDFSCPNDHGWLKFSSESVTDEPVWMPPKTAEYKSSHICPECGAGLLGYAVKTNTFYCPFDHGYFVTAPVGNGGTWLPPMVASKSNGAIA